MKDQTSLTKKLPQEFLVYSMSKRLLENIFLFLLPAYLCEILFVCSNLKGPNFINTFVYIEIIFYKYV